MKIVTRKTFMDKFFSFLSSWFKSKRSAKQEDKSVFVEILDKIEKDTDLYMYASTAADLCENAFSITEKKYNLTDKEKSITARMNELKSFYNLDEDETEALAVMLERFININKEKSNLNNQLMAFDKSLGYLEPIKDDANFIIEQMQEAEKKQRILRHDIGQIEGEKADLQYEQKLFTNILKITKLISYVILISFMLGTSVIGYLYIFQGLDILSPSLFLACGVGVIMTLLFITERKIKFEIQLNIKKQRRAVELLNKKNTINAYYTNYLRFEHKKYKVTSSQMLIRNLKELEHYQYISKRYDSIRKIMYQSEEEVESFLRIHSIKITEPSLIKFSHNMELRDRQENYRELEREISNIKTEIERLDVAHKKIWDNIIALESEKESHKKVIDDLMEIYFDEINKLKEEADNEKVPTQEELEIRMKNKLEQELNERKVDKESIIV